MNYFKYICLLILPFLSTNIYASCPAGNTVVSQTFAGNAGSLYCVQYHSSNCKVLVQSGTIILDGGPLPYASLTGKTCEYTEKPPLQEGCTQLPNGSIECEDPEEEEEPETTLSCTSNMCSNPNSLRCPTNYSGGTFNGNRLCIKNNSNPPDDPTEECGDDIECQEAAEHAQIAVAVNNANSSITDKIGQMASNLSNKLGEIADKLGEIADKIGNIAGGNGNGGNGTGNGNGNGDGEGDGDGDGNGTDTSGLEADVLFITNEEMPQLDQNLFGNNAQCPEPKVLSMPFMGSSISYDFEFTEICNSLNYLSYIVMIMSYLISCYIIIRA